MSPKEASNEKSPKPKAPMTWKLVPKPRIYGKRVLKDGTKLVNVAVSLPRKLTDRAAKDLEHTFRVFGQLWEARPRGVLPQAIRVRGEEMAGRGCTMLSTDYPAIATYAEKGQSFAGYLAYALAKELEHPSKLREVVEPKAKVVPKVKGPKPRVRAVHKNDASAEDAVINGSHPTARTHSVIEPELRAPIVQ